VNDDRRDETPEERAAARRRNPERWPVRAYRLGEEPETDPLDTSTVDERVALVWRLTLEAWELSGRPMPEYERHEIPGRVLRPGDER
jgi:hypothetical protein